MSILKKLVGTMVEFDDPQPGPSAPTGPSATPTNVAPATGIPANIPAASGLNQEMLLMLKKVVENRKTPFTALNEMIDRLAAVPMDDNTRLQAAIASITSDGSRNLDSIIKSIDLHIRDLESEANRFNVTAESKMKTGISSLQSAATQLRESAETNRSMVASLTEKIAALQSEIATSEQKAAELDQQVIDVENDIKKTNTEFAAAVDQVKNDLITKRDSLLSIVK